MLESVGPGPSPWITLVLHNAFPEYSGKLLTLSDLSPSCVLILEVTVLLAQPQPTWALLFKVKQKLAFYSIIRKKVEKHVEI